MVLSLNGNKRIKDTPFLERPREKAQYYGISTLNDAEVLAIIIGQGRKHENALVLASHLLTRHQNLKTMLRFSDPKQFMVRGIGRVKALQLLAAFELNRRIQSRGSKEERGYEKDEVIGLYQRKIGHLKQETLYLVLINKQNLIIGERQLYVGKDDGFSLDSRDIIRELILSDAYRYVLIHNHPSGNVLPSRDDEITTQKLCKITESFGYLLYDHLIVSVDDYYSFRDHYETLLT